MEWGSCPDWHLWFISTDGAHVHQPHATALPEKGEAFSKLTSTLLNSSHLAPSSTVFSDLQNPSLSSLSHAVHLSHYILCTLPAFSGPRSLLTRSLSLRLTLVSLSRSLPLPFWPSKLSCGMNFSSFLIVCTVTSCNSGTEVNQRQSQLLSPVFDF